MGPSADMTAVLTRRERDPQRDHREASGMRLETKACQGLTDTGRRQERFLPRVSGHMALMTP